MNKLSDFAIKLPRFFVWFPVALSFLMMALVLAPTLSPPVAKYLHPLSIDADPENMLFYDDPVRIFDREQKEIFSIYDLIVIGVVNQKDGDGIFNAKSLQNIHDLTNFAKNIQWQNAEGEMEGVISVDLIAPSNVDNIEQGGPGTVKFDWLMEGAPTSDTDVLAIRNRAQNQPLLDGSLVSVDGQALALYIPVTSKDISYKITNMLKDRIATYDGNDEFLFSGLPVAQDTFAVEMFVQMAVASPLAMVFVFFLLWYFFRNIRLIISPMIIAMLSVTVTMCLLVIMGNTVHIMSSMVPIFIMSIAVLDSVHILSEFYDSYPKYNDRKKTILHVMSKLSMPMLFTSLTTAVGFLSLNLTPLPPIQVFGTFVGIGVLVAWFFTVTLIPAYIMLMPESKLTDFGAKHLRQIEGGSLLAKKLPSLGAWSVRNAKPILLVMIAVFGVSAYGISKIQANDNPVKWFAPTHEIRQADNILNDKFAGTYMAYLSVQPKVIEGEPFKDPEVLNYISDFQEYLNTTGLVGKSNSVVEIVKTVHRELYSGDQKQYRIPDSAAAVAQTMITFQNSHRPQDLWHYITPDFQSSTIWMQLKSGDNQDMSKLESLVDSYFDNNPPPLDLKQQWYGLNYINVTWQDQMVLGMAKALAGSFIIVMFMMIFLFKSVRWGLICMVPLSFSVALLYGIIGLMGKDYDAPIAILSALSLGLAVDYAIHFLTRSREMRKDHNSWAETVQAVFDEPARAISRNVIIVGAGFLPLLTSSLVPYQTVGVIISSILVFAGIATLIILPALIQLMENGLFKKYTKKERVNA